VPEAVSMTRADWFTVSANQIPGPRCEGGRQDTDDGTCPDRADWVVDLGDGTMLYHCCNTHLDVSKQDATRLHVLAGGAE
jgi:hypothetical protein